MLANPEIALAEVPLHLKSEGANDQVFDELLIAAIGQTDGHFFLLSKSDEPVESGKEYDGEDNIGQNIGTVD